MRHALLVLALLPGLAAASDGPQPLPPPPPLPVAADIAYPGTIRLEVDARDVLRRIVRVRQALPVRPGPLVLLYPQWVPGAHSPQNSVDRLSGLAISAAGRRLEWRRDPIEMHAFRVDVPAGVSALDMRFELLTPTDAKQGRVTIGDDIAHLQYQSLVLYPAGYFVRGIMVDTRVTVPAGWTLASGLDVAGRDGATTRFAVTDLETLADSPMMAGPLASRTVLDSGPRPVTLDLFAETPQTLAATAPQLATLTAMVTQADRVFGPRPFAHFDFLVALSETLGGIGREHLQSTEIVSHPELFTGWDRAPSRRLVLPHEYVHAWNGKYRRGAGSWTADLNTPIRNGELWLYEGQTQYWATVLAARSGMITAAQARDNLALIASAMSDNAGRSWRPLADTVNDPQVQQRRPQPWPSRQRREDYYNEGALIWLDADTLIRERSGGAKSLDDFARSFFAVTPGRGPRTYTEADVVAALNAVVPHDWAGFLRRRLDGHETAPLDGLARGGYRLVWRDTPTDWQRAVDAAARRVDLSASLGLVVETKDGTIAAVQWDGPAFRAGLTAGAQIIAVSGVPYTTEALLAAVRAAQGKGAGVELIVKTADRLGSVTVDWHGGLRYPRLEAIPGATPRLDAILAPRS